MSRLTVTSLQMAVPYSQQEISTVFRRPWYLAILVEIFLSFSLLSPGVCHMPTFGYLHTAS